MIFLIFIYHFVYQTQQLSMQKIQITKIREKRQYDYEMSYANNNTLKSRDIYQRIWTLQDNMDQDINYIGKQFLRLLYIPRPEEIDKKIAASPQLSLKEIILQCTFSNDEKQLKKKHFLDAIGEFTRLISSICFKYLHQSKLNMKQVELFFAKNILIFVKQVLQAAQEQMTSKVCQYQQQFSALLTEIVEAQILSQISSMLFHYEALTSVSLTKKMQQAIKPLYRITGLKSDLIMNQDISISEYQEYSADKGKVDEDIYADYVDQVINSTLPFLNSKITPTSDETIHEKFSKLTERLYYSSEHRQFRKIISEVAKSSNTQLQTTLMALFLDVLDEKQTIKQSIFKQQSKGIENMLSQIKFQFIKQNYTWKKQNKLPKQWFVCNVPAKLNSKQIINLMNQWIINLEEIFQNPKKYIIQCPNFKNVDNQQVLLDRTSKENLIKKIESQKLFKKVKQEQFFQQFSYLKNCILQKKSRSDSYSRYEMDDCPQISANIMVSLQRKYLCILINHLMAAGSQLKTGENKYQNINLISFKPTNFLKAKIHCSEATFISILNTLTVLDKNLALVNRFKLTKVNNELNQNQNTFSVNFLLYGKAECQLQLCLIQGCGKELHYYNFSQFLSNISKFRMGVIAACQILISQQQQRSQKIKHWSHLGKKRINEGNNKTRLQRIHQKNSVIYVCLSCFDIVIGQDKDSFGKGENLCNRCLLKKYSPFKDILKNVAYDQNDNLIKRIEKQQDLQEIGKDPYVIGVQYRRNRPQWTLYRAFFSQVLWKYELDPIKTSLFNIVEEKQPIKKQKEGLILSAKDLMAADTIYFILKGKRQSIFQALSLLNNQVLFAENTLKDQQKQRQINRIMQSQNEAINYRNNRENYLLFLNCLQSDKSTQLEQRNSKIGDSIKYACFSSMKLSKIDSPLKKLSNLIDLDISDNNIKKAELQSFFNLAQLDLSYNRLVQIDLKNNKNLVKLNICMNQIKSIKNLNNCLKLTHLDSSFNQLKQIDLKSNTRLKKLMLNNNKITWTLNLDKNLELTYLDLSLCSLTQIKLSNNTKLEFLNLSFNDITNSRLKQTENQMQKIVQNLCLVNLINLKHLNVSNNVLNFLNVSNNTKLTTLHAFNVSLQNIDLSKNIYLTELNLSQNEGLRQLNLQSNRYLSVLELYNINTNSIDLSNNQQLTWINLRKNKQLECIDLSNNPLLKMLNLSQTSLASIDLSGNLQLQSLYIQNTLITLIDLTLNRNLKTIDFKNNKNLKQIILFFTDKLQLENIQLHRFTGESKEQCEMLLDFNPHQKKKCQQFVRSLCKEYKNLKVRGFQKESLII